MKNGPTLLKVLSFETPEVCFAEKNSAGSIPESGTNNLAKGTSGLLLQRGHTGYIRSKFYRFYTIYVFIYWLNVVQKSVQMLWPDT